MNVIRVEKNGNYTCMANYHLRDRNLSLKAKGLMSVILSLPDDWKWSVSGLVSICKEGKAAVANALAELRDAGYVTIDKLYPGQTETGRIGYVYTFHERPIEAVQKQESKESQEKQEGGFQCLENQCLENQCLENQCLENPPQLSTNYQVRMESSTYVSSTEDQKRGPRPPAKKSGENENEPGSGQMSLCIEAEKPKRGRRKHAYVIDNPPTLAEVRAYVDEKGYGTHVLADQVYDYYSQRGWRMANGNLLKDWHGAVGQWYHRERKYEMNRPTRNRDAGDYGEWHF